MELFEDETDWEGSGRVELAVMMMMLRDPNASPIHPHHHHSLLSPSPPLPPQSNRVPHQFT